ncbi:MAG: signal peptidase I [Candidatus Goldiibacteriota bacterium]|jgi:signal peptidase I
MEQADIIFWSIFIFFAAAQFSSMYIWKLSGSNRLREWIQPGFEALIIALILRLFVVQAYSIPSQSMEDTLLIGDQLLETKFSYSIALPWQDSIYMKTADPKRGEVIIFKYPEDPKILFVKRCMGVAGDIIEIRDKELYVNGIKANEPYVTHKDPILYAKNEWVRDNYGPVTVPQGSFFVMGDNRDFSLDSRFWGFVPFGYIKGRAWLVYWPLKRWKVIR